MNILYTRNTNVHRPIDDHYERPERLQRAIDLFTQNEPYMSYIDSPEMKNDDEVLSLIKNAQGKKIMKTFIPKDIVTCTKCENKYNIEESSVCSKCGDEDYMWLTTKDTYVCKKSLNAVIECISVLMNAIDNIVERRKRVQYCIVRPPGHHHSSKGKGFCLVNNVWVATEYALQRGYKTPMVIDYDSHHFDGFVELTKPVKGRNRFGVSIHGWSKNIYVYPGTGSASSSNNNILNIPLILDEPEDKFKYTDDKVLDIFRVNAISWIKERNPDIIFVSNGMDSHRDDPLGYSALTGTFYSEIAKILLEFGIPIVYVQEGGYDSYAVLECSKAIVDTLISELV